MFGVNDYFLPCTTLLIYEDLLKHETLSQEETAALLREDKERMIEHQQEIQDQRLREQGIEPPPHMTPEEREAHRAEKRREARKRKRLNRKKRNNRSAISPEREKVQKRCRASMSNPYIVTPTNVPM